MTMRILWCPVFLLFGTLLLPEPSFPASPVPFLAGKDTTYLSLGGALRFNAFFKNW